MIEVIDFGEPWERSLLETAVEISQELEKLYPEHRWEVCFQGGALIIRHAGITEMLSTMNIKGACYLIPQGITRAEALKAAREAGGALLELFQLPRGRWDGREPVVPSNVKSYFQ